MNIKSKYLAIKVEGLDYWLWFDRSKTSTETAIFTGNGGWGKGGAHVDIRVSVSLIEGEIASERLQYL